MIYVAGLACIFIQQLPLLNGCYTLDAFVENLPMWYTSRMLKFETENKFFKKIMTILWNTIGKTVFHHWNAQVWDKFIEKIGRLRRRQKCLTKAYKILLSNVCVWQPMVGTSAKYLKLRILSFVH